MTSILHKLNRSRGFSLVELMIAMVLGLLLTTGIISIFISNKHSSELVQAIGGIQENARLALDTISRDVRMAGFQGCSPIGADSVTIHAKDAPMNDLDAGLQDSFVWASTVVTPDTWFPAPQWGAAFSVPTINKAVPGTHVLMLQFGSPDVYSLNRVVGGDRPDAAGPIEIQTDNTFNIETGDFAIISDCLSGDLFEVTNVADLSGDGSVMELAHGAGPNFTGALSTAYGATPPLLEQASLMRFNARMYYVGDTGLLNGNNDPIYALYEQSFPFDSAINPPVELAQGVEHLAISFITETDTGLREEVDAGTPVIPTTVRAIRIGLLMSSLDDISSKKDTKTYVVANTEIGSPDSGTAIKHNGDRRFRLAFNTTVNIRNIRERQ